MLVERTNCAAARHRPRIGQRFAVVAGLIGVLIGGGGCVRRTLTITSEPEGALCWLNGREVGRTPVTVDFLYYGKYDVQLTHDGFEPLLTFGEAKAPLWDTIPLDLASEVWPGESHSEIKWHYVMQSRETDRDALIVRAQELREKMRLEAPMPPGSPDGVAATMPATQAATEPTTAPEPASQPQ